MKTSPFSSLSSLAVACAILVSPVLAPAQNANLPEKLPAPAEAPLNCRCVVTVDPQYRATESQEQSPKAGFTGPNILEGILIRLDREWLVLKDGSFESWVPREKVLTIRVSR
ncbi:MAG TPA: hypothetical protein VIM57_09060 [Luteolibacter sp.]